MNPNQIRREGQEHEELPPMEPENPSVVAPEDQVPNQPTREPITSSDNLPEAPGVKDNTNHQETPPQNPKIDDMEATSMRDEDRTDKVERLMDQAVDDLSGAQKLVEETNRLQE